MNNTLVIFLFSWLSLMFTFNNGIDEVDIKVVEFDPLDTAVLPCSTPAKRAFWTDSKGIIAEYRNGVKKIWNSRYDLLHKYLNERNLRLSNVKKQDDGIYTCFANRTPIIKYKLIVNYEAKILHSPNVTYDVKELATVGLWCNATGFPVPKTTWYVVDEKGEEHVLGFTGRYLEVRNITRGCSGTYRCKATNRLNGNFPAVVDMHLNTVYPPEVDISLDEPEENVDNFSFDAANIEYTVYYRVPRSNRSTVVLTCHVSANPIATTSWKVGEQVIGNYKSGKTTPFTFQDSYLYEITLVNGALQMTILAYGNHGILFDRPYKCESTNEIGRDYCHVKFKPSI